MLTHLHIVYSSFCTTAAELLIETEMVRLTKPKMFTIWPFTEKVCTHNINVYKSIKNKQEYQKIYYYTEHENICYNIINNRKKMETTIQELLNNLKTSWEWSLVEVWLLLIEIMMPQFAGMSLKE